MNKNTIKGAANEVAGAAQKEFGKLTGNTGHQVKGAIKETAGAVQKEYGKSQDRDRARNEDEEG